MNTVWWSCEDTNKIAFQHLWEMLQPKSSNGLKTTFKKNKHEVATLTWFRINLIGLFYSSLHHCNEKTKENNVEKEKFILVPNFRGLVNHQPYHSSGSEVRQNIMAGRRDRQMQFKMPYPGRWERVGRALCTPKRHLQRPTSFSHNWPSCTCCWVS